MVVSVKHAKTNTVPAWTQTDLDNAIAGNPAPIPSGTLISGFTTTDDWNSDHVIDTTGSNNGDVLTNVGGVAEWASPSTAATLTFMFSATNSDISGYESMPSLPAYTAGALASKVTAGVSTTPTLLEEFATNLGFPNISVIPAGEFTAHYETEKGAGSNNYYTYFEIYKRTSGGTETLIATSDHTTETAVNTVVQQTASAFITSNYALLTTDRIVIKIYAVMLSATATITLYYDGTTDARLEMPSVSADASNFVPYSGATSNVDLNNKNLSNVATVNGVALTNAGVSTKFLAENGTYLVPSGSGAVDSVNGFTGVVVLDTDDIADTATNRYTSDTDITRLANTSGTNTGDQNLFRTIAVSGQSDVVADSTTDTLTLVAGSNVTITTDPTTDSITIAASGGGSTSWGAITGTLSAQTDLQAALDSKEAALTFSTGLTRTTNTITNNLSTGVSGGQTVIGGTASGNSLTLSSTSNATKGKLLFGTSAYDEVNNRLGIGTVTPSAQIHSLSTTEQLRVGYDASNYYSTTVGSTGLVTYDAVGSGAGFTFADNMAVGNVTPLNYSGLTTISAGGATKNGLFALRSTAGVYNGGFYGDSSNTYFESYATNNLVFATNGGISTTPRLTVLGSNGNVGIGTSSPSALFHTISATEQVRVGYNTSNYYSTTVGSTGGVTFNAVGSGASFSFSDKVTVASNDIEVTGSANGVILTSPDATRWRITVDNTGALTTTSI